MLRPSTWTSGDAAGLPITPGLVTYDEVLSGEIRHAIRFTAPRTRREFVWPARHYASSLTGSQYPRMGERFRLKASVDISSYPAEVQVILRAMKKYGIMLADNGSAWYISGQPDPRWNNDHLHTLGQVLGSNFEAVDATVLRIDPNSGAAAQSGVTVSVSPSSAAVRAGRAKIFTATVTGAPNSVAWNVNGIAGGDLVIGTVDASRVGPEQREPDGDLEGEWTHGRRQRRRHDHVVWRLSSAAVGSKPCRCDRQRDGRRRSDSDGHSVRDDFEKMIRVHA